jgi:hypothetical protein
MFACVLLRERLFLNKKVTPLQPWTGLEGFRRLRLPDFKTFGT